MDLVPICYERSDDENITMVPTNNNINGYDNVVSDSENDDEEEENLLGKKLKMNLK